MSDAPAIVTRFAPSPTGYLHIGGARTALFSWLYARGRGGRFLLRIEDTDRARSTSDAVRAILEGLTWLGLDWDGEPVSQFARAHRHREAALDMVAHGTAYRCYVAADALEARRTRAAGLLDQARALEKEGGDGSRLRAEARPLLTAFRSPYRDGRPPPAPDAPYVVRLRAPETGDTVVEDRVQGRVVFPNKDLDDLVLLRADGVPTYNLAVVVDDHDMGVTHVIRGDDHLVNAGRQTLIYKGLGWSPPVFAHIPLIHGPDGKKLSKRHGATGVEAYRDLGYLPEGLRAYLLRLGWSKGDLEILNDDEARAAFDLDGINKAPARLDFEKLAHVNAHFLKRADDERLAALLHDYIARQKPKWPLDAPRRDRLAAATPMLKARARTLAEMAEQAYFLLRERPIAPDEKAARALDPDALARLARLRRALAALSDWREPAIKAAIEAFAAAEGVGLGKIGPALRAALAGGAPAPDLAITLALLGREESLGRIADALGRAEAEA